MTPAEIDNLKLVLITGEPNHYRVDGLPSHLKAEIRGSDQQGYKYRLRRGFNEEFEQKAHGFGSRDANTALEELKRLLKWEPPIGTPRG
jgi:hypothetical protein